MAKIGFIISSFYACGGEERVVSIMANELAKVHEVTVYTYENRQHEGFEKNDYYVSDKVRVERVSAPRDNLLRLAVKIAYYHTGLTDGKLSSYMLRKAYYPQKHLDEWVERINREKYDVMIAVSGTYTMLLGYICDRISARCVSWEHSSFEGYFAPRTGYYRNRKHLYRECAAKLYRCVVLNEDIASKYRDKLGIKATVIPNPKSFQSSKKADMHNHCFVTCGRVEPEKGYDDLIEAFALFAEQNPDWSLVIIGGGSLQNKLELLIQERGLAKKARITGYTHDVQENLLQGSVFVMTSRWEGFPMTVTEALEMGLPVVAYGIPAMGPLVTDGVEGKIVPPFEREKLVAAMLEIAADESLREKMKENALKKAETLEPERIAEVWLQLIEEVMEEPVKKPAQDR